MKQISMAGEWIARGTLLMTGRRSPWGSPPSGDDGAEAADAPGNAPEPAGSIPEGPAGSIPEGPVPPSDPTPPAEGPSSTPNPTGPNPTGPRRGAQGPWGQRGNTAPGTPGAKPGARRPTALEEMFRNRRPQDGTTTRTGGTPGMGGPGIPFRLPPRANGKSWLPLGAAALLVLWLLVSGTHQLGSTEQGIVTTFGKYERTIGPGVSLTLPWPIQTVDTVDVTSIRRESIPDGDAEKLMLTSDQNLVDFSYLVRWNIKNLKLYTFQLDNPDATVREVAEAAMRASVSEVPLNDVMGGAGRSEIEQAVRTRMQAILDAYRSGVLIQGVDIKKADPPARVVAAFQQVTVAQQGAQRDMSNAQAFAQQVVARAQGDAAAFDKVYAQYKLSPVVTRRRMYYETMERVLSNNDKVIMEGNTTSYLPLPEARRRGPSVDVTAGGQ